jgi:hypothetical protein
MTPTPIPEVASSPTTEPPWIVLVVIGLVAVLFVVGLITGQVRLTSSKTRESARRGMLTMDAVLSTPEKQAAIEYIRDEEHLIEIDQERSGGNGDDDEPD